MTLEIAYQGARTRPGGGAAFSTGGGEIWRQADEGRDRHYTWSVALDPVGCQK
jgi:hypothetical protein